jgi:L-aminopeptidase/D-esterase-like protein
MRLLTLLACLALLPAPAFADEAPPAEAPAGAGQGATSFTAPAPTGERVSGLSLMVAAYIAVWVLLAVYVTFLLMRTRNLDADLNDLRGRLSKLEQKHP